MIAETVSSLRLSLCSSRSAAGFHLFLGRSPSPMQPLVASSWDYWLQQSAALPSSFCAAGLDVEERAVHQ
jgi:hypothetical protein